MKTSKMVPAYENRLLKEELSRIITFAKTVEPENLEKAKSMLAIIAGGAEGTLERIKGGPYAG